MDAAPLGMADDAAAAALRSKGVGKQKPVAPPDRAVVRAGATKIKGDLTAVANEGGVSKGFLTIAEARRAARKVRQRAALNRSVAGPMAPGRHKEN